jgi:simple sugar transport system ATP-binding protein
VIFISHNPHHAYMVGDHFILLNRGRMTLDCRAEDINLDELTQQMAGGDELETLTHELKRNAAETPLPQAELESEGTSGS